MQPLPEATGDATRAPPRRGHRSRQGTVGLLEIIGADHLHGTVTAAVDACRTMMDPRS